MRRALKLSAAPEITSHAFQASILICIVLVVLYARSCCGLVSAVCEEAVIVFLAMLNDAQADVHSQATVSLLCWLLVPSARWQTSKQYSIDMLACECTSACAPFNMDRIRWPVPATSQQLLSYCTGKASTHLHLVMQLCLHTPSTSWHDNNIKKLLSLLLFIVIIQFVHVTRHFCAGPTVSFRPTEGSADS